MFKLKIKIKEQLDTGWSDWLSGLDILHTREGNTILEGHVQDSAAFYGILARLSSLGLQLLLVDMKEIKDTESLKNENHI